MFTHFWACTPKRARHYILDLAPSHWSHQDPFTSRLSAERVCRCDDERASAGGGDGCRAVRLQGFRGDLARRSCARADSAAGEQSSVRGIALAPEYASGHIPGTIHIEWRRLVLEQERTPIGGSLLRSKANFAPRAGGHAGM